jgi:hypothetical protein
MTMAISARQQNANRPRIYVQSRQRLSKAAPPLNDGPELLRSNHC